MHFRFQLSTSPSTDGRSLTSCSLPRCCLAQRWPDFDRWRHSGGGGFLAEELWWAGHRRGTGRRPKWCSWGGCCSVLACSCQLLSATPRSESHLAQRSQGRLLVGGGGG
ncbi:hypothetical protein GQ55_5G517000 [Panicum hallii var. hallii]|uniref:Uncharacterized protein n=1 Tax=Panicum hallii var. hallii TaxID=1504633 RepID=A0A2T7DSH6_9POAL|nr:hypothetical protein GQ55_5G517000 [Panicum hallii var. hallii]